MSMKSWFKHAFAVDPPGPAEPNPVEQVAVDWVCIQIAKRHLSTPGLFMLEMTRPLNYVAAQAMHVGQPAVWAIASQTGYRGYVAFSRFLERRGSMEYLSRRVEHFEAEFTRLEKEKKPVGAYIRNHMDGLRKEAAAWGRSHPADKDGESD